MSEIGNFRKAKDEYFGGGQNSPLTPAQQQRFTGLEYFEENEDLEFLLSVEEFPEIRFESTRFIPEGAGSGRLLGTLTLHGVEKPVELVVEVLGFGPGMRGDHRAGFSARTTLDRKDFGITWNRALDQGGLVLGDAVEIRIDLEAVREAPEDTAKKEATPGT